MAGRSTALALAALLAAPVAAEEARITDGDTLRLGAVSVRLFGIDAPEDGQRCADAGGADWDCGDAAAARLAGLAAAGPVRCEPRDVDRYGRLVSVCTAAGVDLGGQLVAEGGAGLRPLQRRLPRSRGRRARGWARALGRGGRSALGLPRRGLHGGGRRGRTTGRLRDQGQPVGRRGAGLSPARQPVLRADADRPQPGGGLVP